MVLIDLTGGSATAVTENMTVPQAEDRVDREAELQLSRELDLVAESAQFRRIPIESLCHSTDDTQTPQEEPTPAIEQQPQRQNNADRFRNKHKIVFEVDHWRVGAPVRRYSLNTDSQSTVVDHGSSQERTQHSEERKPHPCENLSGQQDDPIHPASSMSTSLHNLSPRPSGSKSRSLFASLPPPQRFGVNGEATGVLYRTHNSAMEHDAQAPITKYDCQPRSSSLNLRALPIQDSSWRDRSPARHTTLDWSRKRLGLVTPEDILLIRWRAEQKWSWSLVSAERERHGFRRRDMKTLRNRMHLVIAALKRIRTHRRHQLLDNVARGNEPAIRALNSLLNPNWIASDLWDRPANQGSPYRPRSETVLGYSRTAVSSHSEHAYMPAVAHAQGIAPISPVSLPDAHEQRQTTPKIKEDESEKGVALETQVRPTTSGKTLPADFWLHQVDAIHEAAATVSDVDSEFTPEDHCHFAFRIMRRQCLLNAHDDEETDEPDPEDMPWVHCGEYESLLDANQAVLHNAFRSYRGEPQFATTRCMQMQQQENELGLLEVRIHNPEVGLLDVKAERFLRTLADGIIPASKRDWVRKAVYAVHKRVTRTSTTAATLGDELFDEAAPAMHVEQTTETLVSDDVFAALEMANACAIDAFVKAVHQPASARLNIIDVEREELRRQLTAEIDEETEFFDRTCEVAGASVRVWVVQGRLRGPRNL